MDIDEFIKRFNEIKEKGFIKSLRRGPTGIGNTLETYLGIKENNISLPALEVAVQLFIHNHKGLRVPFF